MIHTFEGEDNRVSKRGISFLSFKGLKHTNLHHNIEKRQVVSLTLRPNSRS